MAGLIGLTSADIEIQDALRTSRWEYEGDWIPHPVVRLTTNLPVAVNKPAGRTVVSARWGFDVGSGRPIGNARDDRLLESPMWKGMVAKSPCLFVSTGIYEMIQEPVKAKQATLGGAGGGAASSAPRGAAPRLLGGEAATAPSRSGEKKSFWFRRVDQRPIVMPGLCAPRKMGPEAKLCAAIVTTQPNKFFRKFHDRQVCTLNEDELDKWMDERDQAKAMRLLHAPNESEWEAVPVDRAIFATGRREMEHLVPVGKPIRWD